MPTTDNLFLLTIWGALAALLLYYTYSKKWRRMPSSREREKDERIAHLEAIMRAASEISIIATDVTGNITWFNRGSERMLGYAAEEMIGKTTPLSIHHPEEVADRGRLLSMESGRVVEGFDVFVEYSRRGLPDTREWTYIRKDGNPITVNLFVTPIHNDKKEITGFLGVGIDITKEKQLMSTLQRNEAEWKQFLDLSPNLVIVHNGSRIAYMNRTAMSLLNVAQDKHLQASMDEFIHADSIDVFRSLSDEAVLEIALLPRNGDIPIYVEMHCSGISHQNERSRLLIAKDVTSKKEAMEGQKRLLSILEESVDFVAMTDLNGSVTYANKAMKDALGLPDDLSRLTLTDLYPELKRGSALAERLAASAAEGVWKGETVLKDREGRPLPVSQVMIAHKDERGNTQYFSIVARDLSMYRAEEDALMSKIVLQRTLEAQEKERMLLAQELHDGVGQSLYYVSLGLQTLRPSIQKAEHRQLYASLQEHLERAIGEIRSFSLQLRPHTLDHLGLIASIRNLINSYRTAYPELEIALHCDAFQDPGWNTDPQVEIHLYRIVQEAFNNTVKHASARVISITLSQRSDGWLCLRFQDDGVGIDKQNAVRGLGLRHMEERVHSLGGSLQVVTSPEQGTALEIAIPPTQLDLPNAGS